MGNQRTPIWHTKLSTETIESLKIQINYQGLLNRPDLKILDFGCGNGRYLRQFKCFFPSAQLFGVDVNKENIEALKIEFKNVYCLNPDTMDLNYPDNFFDLIYSSNVIEHIPRMLYLKYLYKIYSILKTGERFVFGTPNYPFKRLYDIKKALYYLFIKGNFHLFNYYLFDDPTHVNHLNYKILEKDLEIFSTVELTPTTSFLNKFLRNKKYSDKIIGIAVK